MRTTLALFTIGVLVLAGCGGDDDSGDNGSLSDSQAAAAQRAIDQGDAEGFTLDEGCVNDLAAQLDDADAQLLADAGPDENPDLSEEGEQLSDQLLGCVDEDALVDLFIEQIEAEGQQVDDDCVRDALSEFDLADSLQAEEPPPELIEAVLGCIEL